MKMKCSWCGRIWERKIPRHMEPGETSHGICYVCAEKLDRQLDQTIKRTDEAVKIKKCP